MVIKCLGCGRSVRNFKSCWLLMNQEPYPQIRYIHSRCVDRWTDSIVKSLEDKR